MPPADFTPLERAVLDLVCAQHPAQASLLRAQIDAARVVSRSNTGAGFYTDLAVDPAVAAPIDWAGPLAHLNADLAGFEHGLGFIVFQTDGYVSLIEGFSIGEDTSDLRLEDLAVTRLRPFGSLGSAPRGASGTSLD